VLPKQDQMKEAAGLAEKLTQSVLANLREHVGVTKKECEELKNMFVYDEIFDAVVDAYRGAMDTVEERDQE
jgi:hypothetical protein